MDGRSLLRRRLKRNEKAVFRYILAKNGVRARYSIGGIHDESLSDTFSSSTKIAPDTTLGVIL